MNVISYEYRVTEEVDVELMEQEGWIAIAKENFRGSNVFHPIKLPKMGKAKVLMRVQTSPKF